jgi:hypothetical protein
VQRGFQRRRCGERAQASGDHHPTRKRRLALGRVPHRDPFERRHQTDANAGADQRSRRDQPRQRVGEAEGDRADRSDGEQNRLDATRPETVEQHACGNLHQAKREQIRAGEQSERCGIELKLAREIGRDDGIRGPIQVREEIRRCKREIDRPKLHSQPRNMK